MQTPDVAAHNVVAMAGSKGAAGALSRASTRTRRPSAKARAQSAECDHVKKPQAAAGARRGGRAAASEGPSDYVPSPRRLASAGRLMGVVVTEATTPRRRARHVAHRREVERAGRRHICVRRVRSASALPRRLWASLAEIDLGQTSGTPTPTTIIICTTWCSRQYISRVRLAQVLNFCTEDEVRPVTPFTPPMATLVRRCRALQARAPSPYPGCARLRTPIVSRFCG